MRWLFISCLENEKSKIPFFVELRGVNNQEQVNLTKFLYEAITNNRAYLSLEAFETGLKDGGFILILDGLDEVQRDKRDILSRQMVALQDACPGLLIVITSRPDENLNAWSRTRRYYVLPMSKKDAVSLIRKLPYKADVKKKFAAEVESTLYDRHESFLSNPLLMTIMLLTYADIGNVPAKMHIFYEQAFETLFYRHDSWKEAGYQRRHYCNLPVNEFRDCLSSFCISSYKKSQYEFTTGAALDLIERAAKFEQLEVNATDFLKDLEETLCILLLDGLTYKFAHRSFQEYFSAFFISRAPSILLRPLLDDFIARRGDAVTSMAMEMNKGLIEREWVLPRLRELAAAAEKASDPFSFVRKIGGELTYDGKSGPAPQISLDRPGGATDLDFLLTLSQFYPEFRPSAVTDLILPEKDIQNLRRKWNELRDDWKKSRGRLASIEPQIARRNDFNSYANYTFLRAYNQAAGISDEELKWTQFISETDRQFNVWVSGGWRLTDEDASWLQWTGYLEKMRSLPAQIVSFRVRLEQSGARYKKLGAELLD